MQALYEYVLIIKEKNKKLVINEKYKQSFSHECKNESILFFFSL